MDNNRPEEVFTNLEMPKKSFVEQNAYKKYRIYTSDKEFIVIDAETALEAYRKSGIPNPSRIVKVAAAQSKVLPPESLKVDGNPDIVDDSRIHSKLGTDVSGLIETPEINELPEF